jgi:hypothetical protein
LFLFEQAAAGSWIQPYLRTSGGKWEQLAGEVTSGILVADFLAQAVR